MSSDDKRDHDAKDDLVEGLGLLWRAARKTATDIRHDLDRSSVGKTLDEVTKSLDDAGRELARAASHVFGRIGAELKKPHSSEPEEPEASAVDEKRPPAGPTAEDPGFRICVDDVPKDDKGSSS